MNKHIEEFCGKSLMMQPDGAYYVKNEYGTRMATINQAEGGWQIAWDGRWLGLFDNPIQAFRGLALHCIC